ncbi:MAG: hypothetical protein AMXMBFR84_31750 [Candidatus Hydrogenedentota bacterium]
MRAVKRPLRIGLCLITMACSGTAWAQPAVTVKAVEDVYQWTPSNNGSGPFWSFGCTQIVRWNDQVVISEMETGKDVPRLCNTRWRLLRRSKEGWTPWDEAEGYRQREPCPVGVTAQGQLFLNVNDSLHPPGAEYLDCEPGLLRYNLNDTEPSEIKLSPVWVDKPYFTDHSYRGFSVDGPKNEVLMMNIDADTSVQNWCYMTASGEVINKGQASFPIRSCYPQLALENGSGHVLAIGDIVEPVEAWQKHKFATTGAKWDYVFRILYYASTPDAKSQPFGPVVEIANVDATGGAISNQDMWIAPDGAAYILYTEQQSTPIIRDTFMPGTSVIPSLRMAIVKDGKVLIRKTLVEGTAEGSPGHSRFHESADGRLFALIYMNRGGGENVLMQVYPETESPMVATVPFEKPFGTFLLATKRAGCAPSNTIDLVGTCKPDNVISYAQLTIE